MVHQLVVVIEAFDPGGRVVGQVNATWRQARSRWAPGLQSVSASRERSKERQTVKSASPKPAPAVARVRNGTAKKEIARRKDERLRRGEEDGRAESGVIDKLAIELIDGRGLGIVLRKYDADERVREAVR